jgi:hypothetical protein
MAPPADGQSAAEEQMARALAPKSAGSAVRHTAPGARRRVPRASSGRLKAVLDNAPLVLFAIDPAGIVTICEGRGLAEISSETAATVIGRSVFEVFANVPAVHEMVRGALRGKPRGECLDHVIVVSEGHLRRVLAEFMHYYNHARPHRSLSLQNPVPHANPGQGPRSRRRC